MIQPSKSLSIRILILSTLAFTVCFSAWMINGVLVTFLTNQRIFDWSPIQIGWLLGVPVLIGSVFRLPIGIMTDKFGGRWIITAILLLSALPMYFLSFANDYTTFLLLSFCFGLAGTSFAAGVAYTSLWFSKEKQGTALGIFGAGNVGAALTTFFVPSILYKLTNNGVDLENWRMLPKLFAGILLIMAIIFVIATKNKIPSASKTMVQRLAPLKELRVWRFGFYYFFVFGGFVALSQWLIPYFLNVYSMSIISAGFMAACFSLPASLFRVVGGWLSDRVGARMVLLWTLSICLICMVFLFIPRMEIQAPGQGVVAKKSGKVTSVKNDEIIISEDTYLLQNIEGDSSQVAIRFGIHHDQEGFLLLPTTSYHQVPDVQVGEEVVKGQLIAKGVTNIYFQANKWIFSILAFIIGVMMGLGGAAVFKHISDFYPQDIGTVGGIVGVLGGLGGFVGPIIFSFLLNKTGIWTTCWMFLAFIAVLCIIFQRIAKKKVVKIVN
ncbi:MAG TPA: MFS transporter [Saprospiraceae bacterium]|nr:MFS transporter [Saprospiraceae bacterium]HRO09041.1 MFS transporter [Saprospiraceae bacterium]HRP42388.1 MFS transporter [Saprospiraceae bacterium]